MAERSPRISALIVARDEAENLPGCLESLSWADETVVVVDAASRDRTEWVSRSMASKVIVRAFDDFARQRNAGLGLATGDWVFAVDADERATPELAAEIRLAISEPDPVHAGYRVPIRSVVLGRPFRFSGTQHDRPLRLFRREVGRWVGTVHETVDLRGSAGQLVGHLTHRTIPDMHTFLRKIDHYTTLEAIEFHREGRPFRSVDLTLRPLWTFAKLYLGKQGFRDGLEGLAFCALSGLSVAVRHWKHREMTRAARPTNESGRFSKVGGAHPTALPEANLGRVGTAHLSHSSLAPSPLAGEGGGEGAFNEALALDRSARSRRAS
jgi:hypothetical protein